MRHAARRIDAATERPGFWRGTFNAKMDRAIARGARAPATLRRATRDEVALLLDEARRTIPIGTNDAVWPMLAKNPDLAQAIRLSPDAAPCGIFCFLPLNRYGTASLVGGGGFDGRAPDPAWICRPGERPEAIYWWLVHMPGRLFRVLGAIAALFRTIAPEGVPIFSRAANAHSARLQASVGFFEARRVYPAAPDWLLAALPEGRVAEAPAPDPRPRIAVEIVRSMEGLARIFALRSATYLAEQFCTYEEEFDGNDFCATQFLGSVDGDPAGCIRLRYFGDFAKLERLCIRREYRRAGLKEALVQAALDHARAKRFRQVYGHARFDLLDMWTRLGFQPIEGRPVFRFANIDYVEIIRHLEPDPAAIRLGVPPLMTIRPEGAWDEPGPLDLSNIDPDPLRLELIRAHTRFHA